MDDKLTRKLWKIFGLYGSSNAGEREAARTQLEALLAKNGKTFNDFVEFTKTGNARGWIIVDDEPQAASSGDAKPAPLDLISSLLGRYLHLTPAQHVAMTLWIAHTFVYNRYKVTPRLALTSPVRGCGKTTCFALIERLAFNVYKLDHVSAAVLFRLTDKLHACVMVDEGDNQDLLTNSVLRSVLNSGHLDGGKFARVINGEITNFRTFSPLAIAAIGHLPLPLMHRSVVIHMERAALALDDFDLKARPELARVCEAVYDEVFAWARSCKLKPVIEPTEDLDTARAAIVDLIRVRAVDEEPGELIVQLCGTMVLGQ